MFYIIDVTTGEILDQGEYTTIGDKLNDLTVMYSLKDLWVQAACDSKYGLFALDWMVE